MATVTYKCPNCGGGLQFDPDGQAFRCEYCGSGFSEGELQDLRPDSAADVADGEERYRLDQEASRSASDGPDTPEISGAVLYHCPSCGAQIVTDETTAATFCYYCHNPVVLSGRLEGEYLPNYVVPFAIDREKATEIFTQWMKKKRYVPKAFFSKSQIDTLSGVYFPYHLFSCQIAGAIDAEAVKNRIWTTGNIRYTESQRFRVTRRGNMKINHIARNALKKANRQLVEGVLPFDMEKMKPFSIGYLSGFLAEKRDVERQECDGEVEAEVKEFAASSLKDSISGYDTVTVHERNADILGPVWEYALMPVWTLTYKDRKKDKMYYFALNGQTGKICGELPVDMGRLAILFFSIFFPVLAMLLIGGYLL